LDQGKQDQQRSSPPLAILSKQLVTTPKNQAASSWWEEAIYYYVKLPISNLFVENPQFDQKGFELIAHINQYFHPLGAADTLGYIFQLIDIMQGANEPVITLKARFSRLFALLEMGGVNIKPPLQVGFMLRSLLSTYRGVVEVSSLVDTLLPPPRSKLLSINALLTTRTHGRGLLAKTVNLLAAHLQTQRVHQPPPPATMFILSSLWEPFHSTNISITGGTTAKTTAISASYTTTLPATKLTAQKTVPFSSGLVINWSKSSAQHQIPTLHLAWAMTVLHLLLPQPRPR
jgi:hypothetical protein